MIATLGGDGRPSALIHKLQALGLRGRSPDARALLGGPPSDAGRLSGALAEIVRLEAAAGPTAWSRALKGRLLFLMRRTAAARVELDLAVGLDGSLLEARVWRAQASIVLRDAAGALSDLDALADVRPPSGWEDYLRGLALMTLGRAPEAAKRLRLAARRGGGAGASAFLALALAEQGAFSPALKILAGAKGRADAEGVPLGAFEGLILRQAGDLEGSLRALIRAGRGPRPYPWVFSHRADVHNRMGFYQQALVDLRRFHELLPREPAAFAQAANVLYDQAFYAEALKAIEAAARLAPRDHDIAARRAQILVSAGREAEAARVLRAALRLSPDDIHLREELIEAAVMAGRAALARAEIARGGLAETPFGRVMLGALAAREGRSAAALTLLRAAAAGLERGAPLRERALFYAAITRALVARGGKRPPPGLRLCGVGVRHPFQLSVETLRALKESRTIFTNLPDIEARRFLALFRGRVVPVPRRSDQSNRQRALWVIRRLRRREPAAFLTRIHPFIYRRMGWDLLQLCRERELPVKAFGAVSLTELVGCRAVDEGCSPAAGALRVFDIGWLNRNPDLLRPSGPTVIYCIGDDRERPRLVRLLRRTYPASGGAYLLGGSGEREDRAPWTPWGKLGVALRLGDIGCVLYVPENGRPPRALKAAGAPLVRLYGLGTRRPNETTLETLVALADSPAAFVVGRRTPSPAAIIAAARRFGEAAVAIPGGFPLETAYALRLLDACRRDGVAVRATPSISPVGSAFARARFCLGGDYGYQGIQAYSVGRLLADPTIYTPRLPLVLYGGSDAQWKKVGKLLGSRLPKRFGGTVLVPPATAPAVPGPAIRS